jgi:hypothetical protein
MKYIPADIYCLQPNAERVAELESQVAALQSHHRTMREHWQRIYATVIVRALKAEREAAKWEGIAKGMIQEVTE